MDRLTTSIQKNCDISDARHGGDSTMCIYLMRMREQYRWLEGTPPGEPLDHKALGFWIEAREVYLDALENEPYVPINLYGGSHDPFDLAGINREINGSNMLYCAGYGSKGKPVFCLGELAGRWCEAGNEVFVVGAEHAREMSAPVAMSQQNRIYVRRDAFLRIIWELIEEWSWRKPHNAFYKSICSFGFPEDASAAVEALTGHEIENLVQHESGEIQAGELLGARWGDMLMGLTASPLELQARVVRDNLADCLTVLPRLLSERDPASIHFYFSGSHPVRDELWPSLRDAYHRWDDTGDTGPLESAVLPGLDHWLGTAKELMKNFDSRGAGDLSDIKLTVARSVL